jgi:hypothetical protein
LEREPPVIPAKLVYNLDESSFCGWTYVHCITVLVPSNYSGGEVDALFDAFQTIDGSGGN